MRLVHLTDLHLSDPGPWSPRLLLSKRWSGWLSWTRRRSAIHRREVLDRLAAALLADAPDLIIVSGDLVQLGLEHEIVQAREWLAGLGAPGRVFYVPGNHDVYARGSWQAMRSHLDHLLPAAAADRPDGSLQAFPAVRDLGDIRLVGASSACTTPLFSARGEVGAAQQARIEAELRTAADAARLCCLVIHHPPLPGMVKWRKSLRDASAVQALIERRQPALVLCGHLHGNVARRAGDTRVYCTASASSAFNASYRLFDVDHLPAGWRLRMQLRQLAAGEQGCVTAAEESWRVSRAA